jgi:hypothetical protein
MTLREEGIASAAADDDADDADDYVHLDDDDLDPDFPADLPTDAEAEESASE